MSRNCGGSWKKIEIWLVCQSINWLWMHLQDGVYIPYSTKLWQEYIGELVISNFWRGKHWRMLSTMAGGSFGKSSFVAKMVSVQ